MTEAPLPLVRPAELVRVLEKMGFVRIRKSPGGHLRYGHPDGRKTTVPYHEGTTIGRGLLRKILRDVGIDAVQLRALL